jgi:hypothetical protein
VFEFPRNAFHNRHRTERRLLIFDVLLCLSYIGLYEYFTVLIASFLLISRWQSLLPDAYLDVVGWYTRSFSSGSDGPTRHFIRGRERSCVLSQYWAVAWPTSRKLVVPRDIRVHRLRSSSNWQFFVLFYPPTLFLSNDFTHWTFVLPVFDVLLTALTTKNVVGAIFLHVGPCRYDKQRIGSSLTVLSKPQSGARCSVAGWGSMLPACRSRVRFAITLDFSVYVNLPAAQRPWGRLRP